MPVSVKGHVTLDYVRKGKILERIEGDNMCFESSFNATWNWWDRISGDNAYMFLYNSDKAPDPTLPYQRRGNCIGWGSKDQVASGTTQGAWNASKSYDNKVILDGDGISFKWAYDFGVTQMVGNPVKSLGVGYDVVSGYINRYERTSLNETGFITKGYLGYKLNMGGTNRLIQVRSLKQQLVFNDINIAAFVKTDTFDGDRWAIGFASDNNKAYIMLYNGNADKTARRLLYEFKDDTFTNLLQTYSIAVNGKAPYSSSYIPGFAVYNNKIYLPEANVKEYDFVNDTPIVTFTQPISPISIGSYNSGGTDDGVDARNMLFTRNEYLFRGRESYWIPIFNMAKREYEPECWYASDYMNTIRVSGYIEPLIDGSPAVTIYGNNSYPYSLQQMFTCYTLPPDAPARPEDSGISVDYQIDITYV